MPTISSSFRIRCFEPLNSSSVPIYLEYTIWVPICTKKSNYWKEQPTENWKLERWVSKSYLPTDVYFALPNYLTLSSCNHLTSLRFSLSSCWDQNSTIRLFLSCFDLDQHSITQRLNVGVLQKWEQNTTLPEKTRVTWTVSEF